MSRSGGPYLRSSMARAMYERMQTDKEMEKFDKTSWYTCSSELLSPLLLNTFLQLHLDNGSQAFLDNCHQKADWIFTQIFQSLAATFLGLFMTKTSINGWLNRGSMFVMSENQFARLLGVDETWRGEHLLDIGAGDGKVTEIMAKYFTRTSVTEASSVMRSVLTSKNFSVLDIDSWPQDNSKYDVISCLNVLDRCNRPETLLKNMISKIKPESGVILLAVVIPFRPYVEFGHNGTNSPIENFHVHGDTFEEQVNTLRSSVLEPLDLEVVRWTKLPYLCEGNLQRSYFWLTDAVFVLKKKKSVEGTCDSESVCDSESQDSVCEMNAEQLKNLKLEAKTESQASDATRINDAV